MEFLATSDIDGNISVKPIIEKKGEDLIIHMPSLSLIQKLSTDKEKQLKMEKLQNDERDL